MLMIRGWVRDTRRGGLRNGKGGIGVNQGEGIGTMDTIHIISYYIILYHIIDFTFIIIRMLITSLVPAACPLVPIIPTMPH